MPECDADGNQSEPDSMVMDSMAIAGEILLTVPAGQTAEPEKFCKIFCDF